MKNIKNVLYRSGILLAAKKNLENSGLNQRDVYYLFNKEVGGLRVVSQ